MKKFCLYGLMLVLLITSSLGLVGCSGVKDADPSSEGKKTTPIKISSKEFTENILLGKMLAKYLDYNGYPVVDETGLGATGIIRTALTSGQIDAYWEYTGTVLIHFMEHEPVFESEESYNLVKEWDEKNNNIVWLDYAPLNNTYCIVARKDIMDKNEIKTISDMAKFIREGDHLKFVANPEYFERPDGMKHVQGVYGFELPKEDKLLLDLGLFYDALKNNEADLTVGFTTDGIIDALGFGVLKDDLKAFPVYNATPVFRKEIIDEYPELPELVKKLSQLLDDKTAMELNASVDVEGKNIDEVAENFLKEKGLIK
ncbi:ABC transporter substrate-binding protein [Tepidibacter aestuarii]|uniref:ABC transporter substrate-binding protein n=1 Tax=Tepidibacter aestuarii TaxID=2925782 RepID=UPI0020BFA7C2|nr:glycine betaine ABC transporter substrate-binding protein [Tepidibacter aestuarii]CAH2214562.1 osmoprotectant transport system substrate-binding protein [Tepidibacter aestuarii]